MRHSRSSKRNSLGLLIVKIFIFTLCISSLIGAVVSQATVASSQNERSLLLEQINQMHSNNEKLKLPAIHRASKPRTGAFRKAMKTLGTNVENTAVIGDQIFTDVLGGNRMKLFTVLVVPLEGREFWWTTFVRKIERHVLKVVLKEHKGEK